mmetsp:Transcript_6476/g.18847  ORF Transcript_6476/g.18847 Transcript_6476/m.18847 type:complete len:217 (+) Transcript_6476:185-835(+)
MLAAASDVGSALTTGILRHRQHVCDHGLDVIQPLRGLVAALVKACLLEGNSIWSSGGVSCHAENVSEITHLSQLPGALSSITVGHLVVHDNQPVRANAVPPHKLERLESVLSHVVRDAAAVEDAHLQGEAQHLVIFDMEAAQDRGSLCVCLCILVGTRLLGVHRCSTSAPHRSAVLDGCGLGHVERAHGGGRRRRHRSRGAQPHRGRRRGQHFSKT